MVKVDVRPDGSERVRYDFDRYYAYVRLGQLSLYPGYAADSHWHEDVEFILVLSGGMDYNVNGRILHLEQGQGIMVNPRQLHYGFSPQRQECRFLCVLLHPMLLCATEQVERQFVTPFIADSAAPCLLLEPQIPWHRQILADLKGIWDCREKAAAPLYIQSAFYHIWGLLAEHGERRDLPRQQDRQLSILKEMLSFVHKNYSDRILLSHIARVGNVSKSTCLAIFRKYLQDTPANYLIGYRLKRAADLLQDTDRPVSEIALDVGFQGASYFSEAFQKRYGLTPRAYRKKQSALQSAPGRGIITNIDGF